MRKSKVWMLAATLACATMVATTGCNSDKSGKDMDESEIREKVRAFYGENKEIKDGKYDQSLAAKCINGTFVGKLMDSTIVFRGIPYVGKQPVGELRWKAPVDVTPNDGVYEAYYNAKSAPQPEIEVSSFYYQDENCLFLNVWKPLKAPAEKKPVIVWIHGGAYAYGGTVDPLYDFHNFVEENPDVIVVTVAYRLGVLGFLHLSHLPDGKDYPDAQNLGLMDQLQALKWVHENIAAFGGDPDNVTLMGESAGGGSVTNLSLVEGSHQYFNKVIALSGNPCLSTSTETAIAATNDLMKALDCKTVADLQKIDTQRLVEVATEVTMLRNVPERDGRLLPKNPWEAVAGGAVKDLTFMHGVNKDEMNFFLATMGGPKPFIEWFAESKVKKLELMTAKEKALVESYWQDVKGEDYEPYCKWFSQIIFNAPCIRMSEEHTKAGGKSYTYYFTPESALPLMKCGHGMALAPLFKHPEMDGDTGREFDKTFSKTMRKMWVQFAKTGNPSISAVQSPDGKAKEWPLYDLKDKRLMVFDEFNIHPEKESQRKVVDWKRTYPLTKYYGF
ncbi:MAG: carboxylesterase family protein [Prevotella sp.]|nr:carboxylesterase family protein [Prevotella sp.]MBO5614353.1 carboxylesterase family protein [Prevotella sp.]